MNFQQFLDQIKDWITRKRGALNLARQVHVAVQGTTHGDRTKVRVDHRIPAADALHRGWRVTTTRQFLPAAHFDRKVRDKINQASLDRGRRMFCIDLETAEVIAAISYHIDNRPSIPVMITSIGLRIDARALPDLYGRSRGAAYLLKQYVHEIAQQIGRDGYIDIDADSVDALRDLADLGFRRAPRVRGLRISGTHLRQLPLG